MCSEWEIGIEIDSNAKREEVKKVENELMVREKGKKMREKTMLLKKKAEEATRPVERNTYLDAKPNNHREKRKKRHCTSPALDRQPRNGTSMDNDGYDKGFAEGEEKNDKVTVLESEKRAWENSPDAQAIREALNPWRHIDAEDTKKS
ncbi:hypothetical protein LR48_Vigan02g141100 [Vigna angularis]|uniref:Uncharacterized protein n=1 Tax=Phaseolus angularis TaxID=3914 RepID=A0A0L9TXN3_PHAAN|nr:hypothetical protein LR48_Vigan02g141100 [Vigna angularis]